MRCTSVGSATSAAGWCDAERSAEALQASVRWRTKTGCPRSRCCSWAGSAWSRTGGELSDQQVGTRKARLLLQRLAAARGEVLALDALTEAVWADAPPSAPVDNLATLVSRLRASLGADVVVGDRGAWRIGPAVQVDLDVAAALLAQAEAALGRREPTVAAAAATPRGRHADRGRPRRRPGRGLGRRRPDRDGRGPAPGPPGRRHGRRRRRRPGGCRRAGHRGDPSRPVRRGGRARAHAGAPRGRASRPVAWRRTRTLRRRLAEELGADPAPQTRAVHLELLTEGRTVDRRGRRSRAPAAAEPPTPPTMPAPVGGSAHAGAAALPWWPAGPGRSRRGSTPAWSAGGRPRSAASRACCWSWASPGSARPG